MYFAPKKDIDVKFLTDCFVQRSCSIYQILHNCSLPPVLLKNNALQALNFYERISDLFDAHYLLIQILSRSVTGWNILELSRVLQVLFVHFLSDEWSESVKMVLAFLPSATHDFPWKSKIKCVWLTSQTRWNGMKHKSEGQDDINPALGLEVLIGFAPHNFNILCSTILPQ